jgi:hypothetical protein
MIFFSLWVLFSLLKTRKMRLVKPERDGKSIQHQLMNVLINDRSQQLEQSMGLDLLSWFFSSLMCHPGLVLTACVLQAVSSRPLYTPVAHLETQISRIYILDI